MHDTAVTMVPKAPPGAVFFLQTVQGAAIRGLFELLKDVLIEGNFTATSEGLSLLCRDNVRSVIVSVQLDARGFDAYQCDGRYTFGINLATMYKLVKSASSADVVSIWYASDDVLHIRLDNNERGAYTEYLLRLLDVDDAHPDVPTCEFAYVITMPSIDLRRMCNDMSALATKMRLHNDDETLTLQCTGAAAELRTVLSVNQQGLIIKRGPHAPDAPADVPGAEYSLKHMVLFSRGSSISSTVDMFISAGNHPLILQYSVASLGRVLFCLGPLVPEDND